MGFKLVFDLSAQRIYFLTQASPDKGVNFITLLALEDKGAPFFDHHVAAQFAGFGVPVFACTPDLFPDLMAAAIRKRDIWQWAGTNDIVVNQ